MKVVKVGIIGGAGYTAGELLRILINHPQVEIDFVHSNSHAGHKIYETHNDLFGDTELTFTDQVNTNIDVLFLCLGHGKSVEFLEKNNIPVDVRIIDLSQDFRLKGNFTSSNGLAREFVYGLPELRRDEIKKAKNIANPGCFATAFELALLPLAASKLISTEVHINGITGSTGAGQSLSDTTHFSWRNNNISIYKAFNHQHLKEVRLTLETASGSVLPKLNFIPLRGNFSRGIFLSAYTDSNLDAGQLDTLYKNFYKTSTFTFVSDREISVKEVVNTNKCILRVEKYDGKVLVTSVIDNLTKGASGQAVQNMNLMCGLDERAGLSLKPVSF
ncbi:MAG TPA: N-acetyl-gamma-glutamyl-phosphate reductase [Bacteroidales bacterium]